MMQRRLRDQLNAVAVRYRRLRFWQGMALAWFAAAGLGLAVILLPRLGGPRLGLSTSLLTAAAVVFSLLAAGIARRAARDALWIARRIEHKFPELQSCLLAAIEQHPDPRSGQLGYLQSHVIEQALRHSRRGRWTQVVPSRQMRRAVAATAGAFALFVAVLVLLHAPIVSQAQASPGTLEPGEPTGAAFSMTVDPGDAEIEKGNSLLVLATVSGAIPAESSLIWTTAEGLTDRLSMTRTLKDPVFGGRIPGVQAPIDYLVEMGGQSTRLFHVDVFEYPRLERADARLVYPDYTGMSERLVQDVRTLSVVEGTTVTLICTLNKPVSTASLLEENAAPIALQADEPGATMHRATILCDRSRKLTLELVDDRGRKNVREATLTINVVPNVPVVLKPTFPARDVEASALEELDLKATFWDDLGIRRMGLTYSLAGQDPVDVVIGENVSPREKHEESHTLRLESLHAEPDQLLSYHWWAEDLDAAGKPRRTESDMYFAEVRPFEEIFRQGDQPPGGANSPQERQQGQGENEQAAQRLGELQKQVISATWNVLRRETESSLSAAFAEDMQQIALSEHDVNDQAGQLESQVQDAQSQEHLATVLAALQRALASLHESHTRPNLESLRPALAAEQEAYQGMLKLRAREHRVSRQQRQSQSASASARSDQQQRQMEELDLQNEENRYEQQTQAQEEQVETPEERENRQVLNRLRELARRQHDLNERLKELQNSLQEAATEQQKEDIRRQLKRLQEEQQEILRDTEELQSRMESPENQERMSEQRQRLEETREQVQRSREAIEQERVTQAAASGTRAEQSFQDLRDEFRRRNSGRFREDMKEMREAAREIEQAEQEIANQLNRDAGSPDSSQAKSLSDDDERERAAQGLANQQQRLSQLQERIRQTVQEAEATEPLLTERLYETSRALEDRKTDRALQAAELSTRRGLMDDARRQEQAAGQAITQMKEGIEHAAEAVLGDETEALRRAREELQQLTRELNNEIARNDPSSEAANGEPQGDEPPGGETGSAAPPANAGDRTGSGRPNTEEKPDENPENAGQAQRPSDPQADRAGSQPSRPGADSSTDQQQESQNAQGGSQNQPGEGGQSPQADPPNEETATRPGNGRRQGQPGANAPGQNGRDQGQNGQTEQRPQPGRPQAGGASGGGIGPHDEAGEYAPFTGQNFREWSDRLRDVEEIVDDPELRAEAARIRERARDIRAELKRHSGSPRWDLVESDVAGPLRELRERISEELLRRSSQRAVVPLDRDPVPPAWSTKTRLYYERLGKGR